MFRSTQWGQYMSSWRCWSWLRSLSFCLKLWSLLHHRQVCSHSCACRGLSFFPNPCILDFNKHSDQGVKCLASGKGINYIAFCVNSFQYQFSVLIIQHFISTCLVQILASTKMSKCNCFIFKHMKLLTKMNN